MKTKKKEIIPAREIEVVESAMCDLCGAVAKYPNECDRGTDWERDEFDSYITHVCIAKSFNDGRGGFVEGREYHLCPNCFKTKLEPWLQGQGAKPTETHTNW